MLQPLRLTIIMLTVCLSVSLGVLTGCSSHSLTQGAMASLTGGRRATATAGLPTAYSWISLAGVRGGYLNMNDPVTIVPTMKQAGMNAILVKVDYPTPISTETQQQLTAWGNAAYAANMHFFCVFNWRGSLEPLVDSRRYVNDAGAAMSKTPCPLDATYWKTYVQSRMTYLATNGKALHIDGALLDPEMYAADLVEYAGDCYCDDCFREFLTSIGQSTKTLPAPSQRIAWLASHKLTASYQQRFINRIKGFCSATESAVHKANPNFLIGELHLDRPVPFQHGVAMGLGTSTYPVLCFSETTYDTGYTSYVDTMQQTFTTYPASVLFIAGLNILTLPSTSLAQNIYYCAIHSQGYWIYTMECLAGDAATNSYYQLPLANSVYWSAFSSGDAWLDQNASQSSGGSAPVVYPPIDLSGIQPLALTALPVASSLNIGPTTYPRLRYRTPLYILATQGQAVSVQLSNMQLSSYTDASVYAVLDPSGTQIAGGTVALNNTGTITWTPATSGVYTLVVDSGGNAYYLKMVTSQRASYRATSQTPFTVQQVFGNIYFYVPAGVTSFTLTLTSSGNAPGQGGTVQVYDANGSLAATRSGDYTTPTVMSVSVASGLSGKIWAITASGVSNDLSIFPSTNISPCFSVTPAGLLN